MLRMCVNNFSLAIGYMSSQIHKMRCLSHNLLTHYRWGAGIANVKIVFSPLAFQLLYLANARVNTMKEGLPWLLYIW